MFGWASLAKSLIDLKLIDELMVAVHPLILGWWKPLFEEFDNRIKLKLTDSQSYSSWLVLLKYNVEY